jgi:hypothetical protein
MWRVFHPRSQIRDGAPRNSGYQRSACFFREGCQPRTVQEFVDGRDGAQRGTLLLLHFRGGIGWRVHR